MNKRNSFPYSSVTGFTLKTGIANRKLLVILRRQLMYRVDERTSIGRVDFRGDAVAEVEDVAGAAAVAGKDACDFLADGFRASVEHGRVHVALQRNLAADTLTRFADIAGPVQA